MPLLEEIDFATLPKRKSLEEINFSAPPISYPEPPEIAGLSQAGTVMPPRSETSLVSEMATKPAGEPDITLEDIKTIGQATKQIWEENKFYQGEIADILRNMRTRAMSPLAYLMPGVSRKKLIEELDIEAKKFTGFGEAVVPAAGQIAGEAAEWIAYIKAFGLTHKALTTLSKTKKIAHLINSIEKMGGVKKFAQKFPRIYQANKQAIAAGVTGFTVGAGKGGIVSLEEGQVLKRMTVEGGKLGGIAVGFSFASSIDTARYVSKFRKVLVKNTIARYNHKIASLPKGKADPRAKALILQEQLELQQIDNIVAAVEAELTGIKSGKLLKTGQEAVESPERAAARIARYGIEAGRVYPKGRLELKRGLGKPTGEKLRIPVTRTERAVEAIKEAAKIVRHPAKAAQAEIAKGKLPAYKAPPAKVVPAPKAPAKPVKAKQKAGRAAITKPEISMATNAQKAKAHIIAKEKGLISYKGKPTQSYRRFAKAMTNKTSTAKMTQEEAAHFTDMLGALKVGPRGVAKIPTSKHIITKELADKIGKFKDIGALERVRPAWRVFEKIGLTKEVFEPAFEAEISSTEEVFDFRDQAKQMQKLAGKNKATSQKLFRAMESPGTIKLTDNEKKIIDWGKQFFADWANRLRLPVESRRKKYITHIFEREIAQDLKGKHPLDPDLVRALDFITPKTIFNPFLQKRLGKTIGLKEDFWAALEAYENRAVKKFYYEPLIKRIRVYERFLPPNSARYLRNYVTRITGRPLTIDREVNQTLKEAAEEISKLPGGKQLARYLTKGNASGMLAYNMAGIYYECWLGLRPASAIKNLSQHGLALAEVGPDAFYMALKTVGEKRADLLANSKVLRSRKLGYLPGIDQTFIKSLESKRRKITMAMFRAADRKNVSDAFLAGFYEAKTKGLPDDWAYKRGDEVAKKTQYLYSKLTGAQFMQSGPGRMLGILTTWPENWAELMNEWIKGKPSQTYGDYQKATGKQVESTNFLLRRKSLWIYLTLVSLAMLIHKKTPFKALYYTGWTSIGNLANLAAGKFPGFEIPAIIANFVAGIATLDKKRIKSAWTRLKRMPVLIKELRDIISGKKDWINLFIYLETKKEQERKGGRPGRKPGRTGRGGGTR